MFIKNVDQKNEKRKNAFPMKNKIHIFVKNVDPKNEKRKNTFL